MKQRLVAAVFLGVLCALSAGCGSFGVPMKIDSVNNPYLPAAEYKRFAFTPPHAENKVKEQQLLDVVKKEMAEKGFVYDDKSPQFRVDVSFIERSNAVVKEAGAKPVVEITKKVRLIFNDEINKKPNLESMLVWLGEAEATALDSDFRSLDVEKCLVIGILQSYPEKQKSIQKNVNMFRCKN